MRRSLEEERRRNALENVGTGTHLFFQAMDYFDNTSPTYSASETLEHQRRALRGNRRLLCGEVLLEGLLSHLCAVLVG